MGLVCLLKWFDWYRFGSHLQSVELFRGLTCLELGSLSARSTLFPTNLEGKQHRFPPFQPKNSGRKFAWRVVCFFVSQKNQWKQKHKKHIHIYIHIYIHIFINIYIQICSWGKKRKTHLQTNMVCFFEKRFNLKDLVVSNSFFFGGDVLTFVARWFHVKEYEVTQVFSVYSILFKNHRLTIANLSSGQPRFTGNKILC